MRAVVAGKFVAACRKSSQELANTYSMTLHQLPPDMLREIMRHLAAVDLAALSAQNKYLRKQAGEDELWEPLLRARWPDCCTASEYDSVRSLHSTRATIPAAIGLYVDKVARLQRRACEDACSGAQLGDVFEDTMRTAHMIEPLLDLAPPMLDVKRTAEHRRLVSTMRWWLEHHPKVAVAFVRETTQLAQEGRGASLQVQWRRSAIAFLAALLRCTPCQALNASVFEVLRSATAALDRAMQPVQPSASVQRRPAVAAPTRRSLHDGCWRTSQISSSFSRQLVVSPRMVASPA